MGIISTYKHIRSGTNGHNKHIHIWSGTNGYKHIYIRSGDKWAY